MRNRSTGRLFCIICGKEKQQVKAMHCFPKGHQRLQQWKDALNFSSLQCIPRRWRICSAHFKEEDYRNGSSDLLNPNAVPFLPKQKAEVSIDSINKVVIQEDSASDLFIKQHCIVCGRQQNEIRTLHTFPTEQEKLRQWGEALKRNLLPQVPDSWRICSLHFTPDCYTPTSPQRLNTDTVPFACTQAEDGLATQPSSAIVESGNNVEANLQHTEMVESNDTEDDVIGEKHLAEECKSDENMLGNNSEILHFQRETIESVACPTNYSNGGNSANLIPQPENNVLNSSDGQTVEENFVSGSFPPELVDMTVVNSSSSKIKQNSATEMDHLNVTSQLYCNENQYNSGAAPNERNRRSTGGQTNLFDATSFKKPQEAHASVNVTEEEIFIIVEGPHFKSVKIRLEDCNRTTEVCRICLQSVEDDAAINLDSAKDDAVPIKSMLEFVLPDLDLGLYPNAVICTKCGELLMFSYQFKEKWLITEDILQNIIKEKQGVLNEPIDLVIAGKSQRAETQDTETVHTPVVNDNDTTSEEITTSNLTGLLQEIPDVQTGAGEEILHEPSSHNAEANATEPVTVKPVKKRKRYVRTLKSYLCEKCGLIFAKRCNFKYHLMKHERPSLVERTKKRNILCELCGQLFVTARTLEFHLQKHSGFNCTFCAKVFMSRSRLREHVEVQHLRKVSHQCHICGKQLSYKWGLDKHVLQHNPASKVLACHLCDKKFTWPAHLRRHLVSHAPSKIFECKYCGSFMKHRISLKKHIKIYHLNEPENVCEFCHRIYWKKYDLEKHKIRTHSQEYRNIPNENKEL